MIEKIAQEDWYKILPTLRETRMMNLSTLRETEKRKKGTLTARTYPTKFLFLECANWSASNCADQLEYFQVSLFLFSVQFMYN